MSTTLKKIESFLDQHHILMLATSSENHPQASTLFYAYCPDEVAFIVASDPSTEHIHNVNENAHVAGAVALETKEVGKIQGVQFKGTMRLTSENEDARLYFKAFPYAKVMNPVLWKIVLKSIKLTDNRLGFGKKFTWDRP